VYTVGTCAEWIRLNQDGAQWWVRMSSSTRSEGDEIFVLQYVVHFLVSSAALNFLRRG